MPADGHLFRRAIVVAESIPIYSVLKGLIKHLPSFLFKRHFTAKRLADLVYCDLVPRGEAAYINVGAVASANVYLQVINLSPFPVEMDRAQLNMNCGGGSIDFVQLTRLSVEPGVIAHLHLQASITDGSARAIACTSESPVKAWLNGSLEFNCSVRNFSKRIGLADIRPVVANVETRRATA